MKLLFCDKCKDLFKLGYTYKTCECGHVAGYYIDRSNAIVNGNGYSLAIGNGSLMRGISTAIARKGLGRKDYIDTARIMCWARPHTGIGNPYTRVDPVMQSKATQMD